MVFAAFWKALASGASLNHMVFFYIILLMRTIHYPGAAAPAKGQTCSDNHAGRGASLEEDLNLSNQYYRDINKAVVYKKPTPVQVVHVDYPKRGKAKITEAFYRTPSTTDYNGLYKGRYIDFEAKQTRNKTSFPKYLVAEHQIRHLKQICALGGIGFFIVRFSVLGRTYLADAMEMIAVLEDGQASSIPVKWFEQHGLLLQEGLAPRISYLQAVDEKYLKGE